MTVANIELPEAELRAFCEKWGIVELALFGSVLRDDFGPESDVDVLVTFGREDLHTLFDYPRMEAELEAVFHRPVDVVNRDGVLEDPNWLRRRRILESARTVYAVPG